jgi:hypothetical protein
MFKSSTARVRLFTQFKLERRSSLLFCKSYQELINNSPSMSTVSIIFFSTEFYSVPFQASELALPRNSECLGMSTLFRGITESVPSLFRVIFLDPNSVPNPMYSTNPELCSVPWTHQYTAWHWEPEIEFMKVHFRWEFWGGSLKKLSLAGLAKLTPA